MQTIAYPQAYISISKKGDIKVRQSGRGDCHTFQNEWKAFSVAHGNITENDGSFIGPDLSRK